MSSKTTIVYKSKFNGLLGSSRQADYLIRYLIEIGAKSCIVEENYTDKDYLIDYQMFYSRSFHEYKRVVTRYHFFGKRIYSKTFEKKLETGDLKSIKSLLSPYLGFVITKPVRDKDSNLLIGRTLLKTYDEKEGQNRRVFITSKYSVSLFGVRLEIESIPFQMQDRRVSACATIALWTTFHALSREFEIHHYSPGEVTEISTSAIISQLRDFPQDGLSVHQMINCIKAVGLDIEPFNVDDSTCKLIPLIVRAFLSAKLPIIANLKLTKKGKSVRHAAVITGYKHDLHGNVVELYVHDDGIGPYSRVKPDVKKGFMNWDNEWVKNGHSVKLERLIIPVYPKIRLLFKRIYKTSQAHRSQINEILRLRKINASFDIRVCLYTIQDYKEMLLKNRIKSRSKILRTRMPRFVWVEHYYLNKKRSFDLVYDGTAVYPEVVLKEPIEYL